MRYPVGCTVSHDQQHIFSFKDNSWQRGTKGCHFIKYDEVNTGSAVLSSWGQTKTGGQTKDLYFISSLFVSHTDSLTLHPSFSLLRPTTVTHSPGI